MNILLPKLIFTLIFFYATMALANAGLPMVIIQGPFLLLVILPVVLLETIVVKKHTGLKFSRSSKVVITANTISTLIGIPITYAIVLFCEFTLSTFGGWIGNTAGQVISTAGYILFPAFLVPFSEKLELLFLPWIIVAGIILMIFFFFVSWKVEFFVAKKMLSDGNIPKSKLNSVFMQANIASYICMTLIWIGYICVIFPKYK